MKKLTYMDKLSRLDQIRVKLNGADHRLRKAFENGREMEEIDLQLIESLNSIADDASNLCKALKGTG